MAHKRRVWSTVSKLQTLGEKTVEISIAGEYILVSIIRK